MLLTGKEMFPLLGMGNITLEKDNLNVKAFFSGKNNIIKHFLKRNGKLAAYSRVYFIVSAPKNVESTFVIPPEILKNPQKRFANIARYFRLTSMNSLGWYKNLGKKYYMNSIPLDEIFVKPGKVTESELTNNISISDINFEIDIPIEESLYKRTNIEEVYLHAFVLLDVKSMIDSGEITKISKSLSGFVKVGGNLRSKKILEKMEGKLVSPSTKTILALESGEAYNGKYQNFSGQGLMTLDRKPLKRIQVPEKVVSANYLLETSAKPVGSTTPEETKKTLGYSFSKPVLQITKSDISNENLKEELYYPDYLENIKKDMVIKQIIDPDSTYITNSVHSTNTKDSPSHDIRFVLDWEKIVKNKTKLGYLIDIANKDKSINNLITVASTDSKSFSSVDLLSRVRVKELFLKRKRVDSDDEAEVIASISNYSFAKRYVDTKVSLEVKRDNQISKTMLIRDYDLFSQPHTGKYSYSIELLLEDKNIEYFSKLLKVFRVDLKICDMLLDSIDYMPSVKKEILNKDKIKDKSKYLGESLVSIPRAIDTYIILLCWFGKGLTRAELIKLRSDLFTMTTPEYGGTFSGLQKFREYCEIMASNLEDMLRKVREKENTDNIATKKNSRKVSKPSSMQNEEFLIPGFTSAIEQDQILVTFPASLSKQVVSQSRPDINKSALSVEPSEFLYKKKASVSKILTKNQLAAETNKTKKENSLLILDNAIKASSPGPSALNKINTAEPLPSLSEVFGISGVSVAVPTSEGVFNASDISKKNISTDAEADAKASLGSTIKASITSSIVNKTGKVKLEAQEKKEKSSESLVIKRKVVLTKALKMLSMLEDKEPKHVKGSKPSAKINSSSNLEEEVFKKRSGYITVGTPSGSGEMEFKPLNTLTLSEISEEEVLVRIQPPIAKNKKENYKSVNDTFETTKTSLKNLLKENR